MDSRKPGRRYSTHRSGSKVLSGVSLQWSSQKKSTSVVCNTVTSYSRMSNMECNSSGFSQTTVADHYVIRRYRVSVPLDRYKPYDK
jgi:hypothetical protein